AGKIFVKDDTVTMDQLIPKLTQLAGDNGMEERIYVRGDKTANYGAVMQVMGAINGAGFTHIGLIALKEPDS
ncbi:MAG: biopolymer transporter ExbD, partial [Rhizobiales bacterium]|nr:biopolymer transporter ExbD [Hyphomicrobiales bacterium]